MFWHFVPVDGVEYFSGIFGRERYVFVFPENKPVDITLGCDFFAPIHKYTNTQKTVFLLCEGFLPSQPSFVYLFCQKGDFFGRIHGYTYKMNNFLFVYSFFLFVARIEGQIFVSFWDTNKYTNTKKDTK